MRTPVYWKPPVWKALYSRHVFILDVPHGVDIPRAIQWSFYVLRSSAETQLHRPGQIPKVPAKDLIQVDVGISLRIDRKWYYSLFGIDSEQHSPDNIAPIVFCIEHGLVDLTGIRDGSPGITDGTEGGQA